MLGPQVDYSGHRSSTQNGILARRASSTHAPTSTAYWPEGQYVICVDHTREGQFQNATERLTCGYGKKKKAAVREVETIHIPPREKHVKTKNWRHTRYLRRGPSLPPDGSGQVQNLSRQFFQAAYMHFEARTRAPGGSRRYLSPVGGQKTGSRPIPEGEGVHH